MVQKLLFIYSFICDRFNNGINSSNYVVSNNMMVNEQWIGKNTEHSGHGSTWGTIQAFIWRDWEKPRKMSFNVTGLRAEILTRDPQNTEQDL